MDIDKILTAELSDDVQPQPARDTLADEIKVSRMVLERFPVLESRLHIQGQKRIMLDALSRRDFEKVFRFLTNMGGFNTLQQITGLDNIDNLCFNYVLLNEDNVLLILKQRVPKQRPAIKSVCNQFPNAIWHERELVDLFGVSVEELPDGPSYPLYEGWPDSNYPLYKDWRGIQQIEESETE